MKRKDFINTISLLSLGAALPAWANELYSDESPFAKRLQPVGRALELEGYYVWCNSPIEDDYGKVHLFFSRWDSKKGMGGWIKGSEIAHAMADTPAGPYEVIETVLAPRPGFWDATTCHNPSIKKVDGQYCLFYMGNSNGKTNTKRIGLATAPTLSGPWTRSAQPLLEAGEEGAWDDHCTTNPAFVKHPNGQYWLYYKSWNTRDYETGSGPIKGNRKYGLAIADQIWGPYKKHPSNPLIDFSGKGNNTQLEDAFVWIEKKKFNLLARDMGVFNHVNGILLQSKNGLAWNDPKIAYYAADHYIQQPPAPAHLKKYGRFERPQLLFQNGKPTYLFTTSQGGKYMTSSPFIFRIS
ncbi:family 43 glycosylhydrolase [Sediminibacterium roseum]|uniref:Family 43 glycosylhydrolase n=1 Tax=Sediminibacterium roseum TaxID=1978412 RepID=A0ABW9ZRH8_9BACT|nr:glycoside hydrolase family protein [Sediminibacterium roseum]NCI49709.1 family 43 glycosylhydrolase [Sediminibacterium roseum]